MGRTYAESLLNYFMAPWTPEDNFTLGDWKFIWIKATNLLNKAHKINRKQGRSIIII